MQRYKCSCHMAGCNSVARNVPAVSIKHLLSALADAQHRFPDHSLRDSKRCATQPRFVPRNGLVAGLLLQSHSSLNLAPQERSDRCSGLANTSGSRSPRSSSPPSRPSPSCSCIQWGRCPRARREAGLERLAPIYSRRRPAAYMPYETRSRRDAGPPAEERLASRGWLSLSPTPGCIRAIQHHKQKRCTGLQAAIWKCILSCSRSVHLSDILLH